MQAAIQYEALVINIWVWVYCQVFLSRFFVRINEIIKLGGSISDQFCP